MRPRRPLTAYHVVVPFDRVADGRLTPLKASTLSTRENAQRRAEALARVYPGVVAFTCLGDPEAGTWSEPDVFVTIGEVDMDALSVQ